MLLRFVLRSSRIANPGCGALLVGVANTEAGIQYLLLAQGPVVHKIL